MQSDGWVDFKGALTIKEKITILSKFALYTPQPDTQNMIQN
jgi:hypothetical protein